MTEIPAGGLQVIREAVAARASAHAIMARDVGCALDLIDAFAKGRADIPDPNLDLIVKWIWNDNIEYNAEADALQPVQKPEPRSLGIPPTLNIALREYTLGPLQRPGPQPVVAAPPKPKQHRGWIGGVWE
jgi:hypothetical protein